MRYTLYARSYYGAYVVHIIVYVRASGKEIGTTKTGNLVRRRKREGVIFSFNLLYDTYTNNT